MPNLCLNDHTCKENLVANITAKITQGSEITSADLHALDDLLLSGDDSQVPYLDRSFLRHSNESQPQLVRHLGMVQNMLDPEYYVSKSGGKSTHFRDFPVTSDHPDDDFASNLAERTPLMVVPIPFASDWFVDRLRSPPSSTACSPTIVMTKIPESPEATVTNRKRDRESPEEEEAWTSKQRTQNDDLNRMDCDHHSDSNEPSREESSPDWWPAGCMESAADQCPVLAKLYYDHCSSFDCKRKRKLRLNDLVEMVGVLSLDPWEAEFSTEDDFFSAAPPPPSRLPRLHVLSYRILDLDALTRSLVPGNKVIQDQDEQPSGTMSSDLLTDALKNPLLAETLLMALHSTAERKVSNHGDEPSWEMQRAPQHALGCASLQLSTSSSKALYDQLEGVLKAICPVVASIDLSKHRITSPSNGNMDSQQTMTPPSKVNGRMMASPWQLPKGSTLLIHIDDSCRTNIDLLVELVSQHRIPYVFDGDMRFPFDADYRVVVVSSTKTKLPCTLQLALGNLEMAGTSNLSMLRSSLANCRKESSNIGLSKDFLEKTQNDFLHRRSEARKLEKDLPQEEDFHRWLILTRLQARSRTDSSAMATIQDWENALVLDDAIQETK